MRVVLDTNVVVSGLIKPTGRMEPIFAALDRGRFQYLYSRTTLDEIIDVVSRPWLEKKYNIRRVDIESLVKLLLFHGREVSPKRSFQACRDPKDDPLLDVAVEGEADYLISGDRDLLSLHPFQGVPIVAPQQFLAQLN